jgi:hypothetical protein
VRYDWAAPEAVVDFEPLLADIAEFEQAVNKSEATLPPNIVQSLRRVARSLRDVAATMAGSRRRNRWAVGRWLFQFLSMAVAVARRDSMTAWDMWLRLLTWADQSWLAVKIAYLEPRAGATTPPARAT